jgi:hypothetical protein
MAQSFDGDLWISTFDITLIVLYYMHLLHLPRLLDIRLENNHAVVLLYLSSFSFSFWYHSMLDRLARDPYPFPSDLVNS